MSNTLRATIGNLDEEREFSAPVALFARVDAASLGLTIEARDFDDERGLSFTVFTTGGEEGGDSFCLGEFVPDPDNPRRLVFVPDPDNAR